MLINLETRATIVETSMRRSSAMKMCSTISWDVKNGFIKTWDQMRSVEIHNGRGTPLAHVVDNAPPPEYLLGSPRIVADARQRLLDHGIDPDNRRREGVIAREVVLSASHEFFVAGSASDRADRLEKWKAAQVPFLTERFGRHRLVSVVVHCDEYTPHVHAVVLAIKHAPDRQRGREWTLAGEVLAATGKWAQDQTAYAHAMAPFGLSRGKEKSENKHKPYGERMSEIDAAHAAVQIERQDLAERQSAVEHAFVTLRDGWNNLAVVQKRVTEEGREAVSAREAAVALVKEALEAQAATRANERLIEHGFDLLRQQQACADAREADLEKRERTLKAASSTGAVSLIANQHNQMAAGLSH
jgi:hypothetical protein